MDLCGLIARIYLATDMRHFTKLEVMPFIKEPIQLTSKTADMILGYSHGEAPE
jgi:hypothetical protein